MFFYYSIEFFYTRVTYLKKETIMKQIEYIVHKYSVQQLTVIMLLYLYTYIAIILYGLFFNMNLTFRLRTKFTPLHYWNVLPG